MTIKAQTDTEQSDSDFTRLAWELARRATFRLDTQTNAGTDRVIAATIETHAGPVTGYGATHNQAMRHLAEGLDLWAEEFAGQPILVESESVATGPPTIVVEGCRI